MILALGGLEVSDGSIGSQVWQYSVWLGQESDVFGRSVSKMGGLLY